MGVQGLWEVLQPAAKAVPLTRLSLDAFEKAGLGQGPDGADTGVRALRIGVDASLWIFHARTVAGGSNPLLRTLMFRTLKLLQHPVVPVFVFDGPNKPLLKRGNKVVGRWGQDWESKQFKALLDICGWCWWDAPGEAEAELALLSRQKKIDVVMTDDVDALVFGAEIVLRNPSRTLSGYNKHESSAPAFETREDYQVYKLSEIASPLDEGRPDSVGLDVDQMIFVALCSGGDYHPAGIPGCGIKIAVGLARSGLAKELLHCYRTASPQAFNVYLPAFRDALKRELAENTSGFLPNKRKALAASLPADFPDLVVLEHYVRPAVSAAAGGWPGFSAGNRFGRGDSRSWARACEKFFEWGYAEEIGRRLRTLAWRGEIIAGAGVKLGRTGSGEETIRRRERSKEAEAGASSAFRTMAPFPLPRLIKIHAQRTHRSTDSTPEYRIEYDPSEWTTIALEAIDGTRPPPESLSTEQREALGMVPLTPSKARAEQSSASDYEPSSGAEDALLSPRKQRQRKEVDLSSSDKVWIPTGIIDAAYPDLVERYQADLREKELRKTPKKGKAASNTPVKQRPRDAVADKQRSLMAGWLTAAKPSGVDKPADVFTIARKNAAPPKTPFNRTRHTEIIEIEDSPDRTPRHSATTADSTNERSEAPTAAARRPCHERQPTAKSTRQTGRAAASSIPDSPIVLDLDDGPEPADVDEEIEQLEPTPQRQRLARAARAISRLNPTQVAANAASTAPSGAPARARPRSAAQQQVLPFMQEKSREAAKTTSSSQSPDPAASKALAPASAAVKPAPAVSRPRRQPVKFRLVWETEAEAHYEQVTPTTSPAATRVGSSSVDS